MFVVYVHGMSVHISQVVETGIQILVRFRQHTSSWVLICHSDFIWLKLSINKIWFFLIPCQGVNNIFNNKFYLFLNQMHWSLFSEYMYWSGMLGIFWFRFFQKHLRSRGRPCHTVWISDRHLMGRHIGKIQNGRHPGEMSVAV